MVAPREPGRGPGRGAFAVTAMLWLGVAAVAVPATGGPSPGPPQAETEDCLACHGDRGLTTGAPESRPLFVDGHAFATSVHGRDLQCTDCHPGLAEVPHPPKPPRSDAERRAGSREACKACHFENYRQSFDSVHERVLARGDVHAPSCVDCHGAHGTAPAAEPRSAISRTCAACHRGISDAYARSVHGHALLETENADVPVCTDCHRGHAIADPRAENWLLRTPELCSGCHADKERMSKYGLSTAVSQTYIADFHGMTASLTRGDGEPAPRVTALCIDCHGVHDITRVKDPGSPVLKANLVKTCRKCHEGATESFPAAWLSHYEPSWQTAPLVHGVKVFYGLFIPFVIGGLALQILLHLWRVVVNR